MNLINELRMLAEDLHVNGYNRYSAAMSKAADELAKWEAVFGHLGGTPDERGNAIIAAFDEQNAQIERYKKAAEIYAAERDHANQRYFNAVRLLTGIHALLYPPRFTDHDGRTWQFKSPLAEEQMQALSDCIRALPDEIARAALEDLK